LSARIFERDNMPYSVIGKSVPRVDSVVKVTGQAKFAGDISLPGMLVGKILRSKYAHAKILNIDVSEAEKVKGVKAIITGKDTPGKTYGLFARDEPPLAVNKVRYIGDEIAAVAAIDGDTANEALNLIQVEYQVLPAVFDPIEAMQPGAPQIHEVPFNIVKKVFVKEGDVEKGFEASDYVFQDEFVSKFVIHASLETHSSVAVYDPSGKLTVWSSTQGPFALRNALAQTLGISTNRIRVIKPHVGGGFGGKNEMLANDFCAALLSMKTGRPVKIVYSREEEFIGTRRRHPLIVQIKTGVKKDGTLIAKQCKLIADSGAYGSRSPAIVMMCGAWMNMQYRIPHWSYEGYAVYTNNPVTGAQRGWAAPTVRFADDSQMDIIASALGIDPIEIRLKNAVRSGDITPNRFKITSCGLSECIELVAEKTKFKEKWGKLPPNRGIGIACGAFWSGSKVLPHDTAAAVIELHEDGTVNLLTGASDIGQGSDTVLCQILAEELGIRVEDIRITTADTDLVPFDFGTFASRVTLYSGNAVKAAAKDAKRQLFEVIAERMEANIEDIQCRDRMISVKGSPEKGMSFADGVKAALYTKGITIIGRGTYNPPEIEPFCMETGVANVAPAYSFAAQVAEVEVDPLTGQLKVLKVTAAQDCGCAVNPAGLESQIEGSISQGIGQCLLEEVVMDQGRVLNPSFLSYKVPLASNMSMMEPLLVESDEIEGPFGAKGVGEATQIPTAAAIANAIYDAIGVRIKELPILPGKILLSKET
jgi:4-hydroxybenzoyl-CoA reductase alpha subunit